MERKKLFDLKWFDILVLTLILFGRAIYTSNLWYVSSGFPLFADASATEFDSYANYRALFEQGLLLVVAFAYLRIRNFDFSRWKVKFDLKSVAIGVALFAFTSLVMDLYFMAADSIIYSAMPSANILMREDVSVVIYAILNGFYEEIYFLGMIMSVEKKYLPIAFAFSIVIRVAFHTYQGLLPALGIGVLLGLIYGFLYKKLKPENLLPFFVAHAIADVLGLSIISRLY